MSSAQQQVSTAPGPPAVPDLIPFSPVGTGEDTAVTRFTELRWAGLHRFAQLLRGPLGEDDAACLDTCLRVLGERREDWPAIALHPYYTQWWARLSMAMRAGRQQAVSDLIPELSRFLVVPLARQCGLAGTTLTLPPPGSGEVRLPGHRRHLRVPKLAVDRRLTLRIEDGLAEISDGNAGVRVHVGDLLNERANGAAGSLASRTWIPGTRIEVDSTDPWLVDYLEQESVTKPSPGRSRDDVVPATVTDDDLQRLAATVSWLADAWPEMYREILGYVRLVVPFTSEVRAAFSNVAWHGAVFLRPTLDDQVANVERLVHETSHLRLNLVMAHTPLHEHAPDDILPSPFRAGPRPVGGLYHGAFVVTRAAVALDRIHRHSGQERYAERIPILLAQVTTALDTLRRHARLTPVGSALLDEAAEYAEALAGVYGIADASEPRVYLEL
jgi:HEXXH motif-containing protein